MTIGELGLNVAVGLLIIISIVALITIIVNIVNNTYTKSNPKNIFLGKLSNSDSSIEDAARFLKLTNGINQLDSKGKKINGTHTS
jgi:hypothetical protein